MTGSSPAAVVGRLLDILTPLSSEERHRYIAASLVLLGENAPKIKDAEDHASDTGDEPSGQLPAKAKLWAKQNNISSDQIWQVFHEIETGVEIIAAAIPGQSNKEKVRAAYILSGAANFLQTGTPSFDDKSARAVCERFGFYDKTNHSKALKGGNEFTGSIQNGWTLTAPGLKRAATLVKELSVSND